MVNLNLKAGSYTIPFTGAQPGAWQKYTDWIRQAIS